MALDESTRHALHTRFAEVLGDQHAAAAMTAYPAAGEELATKRDLEMVRLDLRSALHEEIHKAMAAQTKTVMFGMIGTVVAAGSLIIAGVAALG